MKPQKAKPTSRRKAKPVQRKETPAGRHSRRRVVGVVAGAVIGGVVAGPLGAALGAAVGATHRRVPAAPAKTPLPAKADGQKPAKHSPITKTRTQRPVRKRVRGNIYPPIP